MKYRSLNGLAVSEIGFGGWGIGGGHWKGGNDDEALAALHRAVDGGLTFIDTALAYGQGHSERLIAQLLRSRTERLHVATKIPPKNHEWPARPGSLVEEMFPRAHIIACTETSLKNLGVERLDLQQLHVWTAAWTDHSEWYDAFKELQRTGKIDRFGISINDHEPDTALSVVRAGRVDTVQVIYNIFDPTPAARLFPLCLEKNVGVIVRCPFDEGGLTGAVGLRSHFEAGDWRANYFTGLRRGRLALHVGRLRRLLDGDGTLPELALRFCLSNPAVSTVIPGMRRVAHVDANLAAAAAGALPEATLRALADHAWPRNFYAD